MRWVILIVLAGCLAKSKPVTMPNGERALRIECNYTLDNCKREARKLCDNGYDEVTRGDMSCRDCGEHYSNGTSATFQPNDEAQLESNVFKGVIYVRCN